MYSQFMMHGQKNIKLNHKLCDTGATIYMHQIFTLHNWRRNWRGCLISVTYFTERMVITNAIHISSQVILIRIKLAVNR